MNVNTATKHERVKWMVDTCSWEEHGNIMLYKRKGNCDKMLYCDGESLLNWVIGRWGNLSKWGKLCWKRIQILRYLLVDEKKVINWVIGRWTDISLWVIDRDCSKWMIGGEIYKTRYFLWNKENVYLN